MEFIAAVASSSRSLAKMRFTGPRRNTPPLELSRVNTGTSGAPLFGEGLGLDSIDALELGLALKKAYGITLTAESEEARRVFTSVATLAEYIAAHRA